MRRAAWCESCRKPFQAKSRKQTKCPDCATEPDEESSDGEEDRDDPLVNTLDGREDARSLVERYAAQSRPAVVESEINCPECAEKIKSKAKTCRFCGADVTERGARERRRDRQRGGGRDRGSRRSGDCPCGGFRVPKIPVYAIVLAILFFPLGLLFLLIKEQRCNRCGT